MMKIRTSCRSGIQLIAMPLALCLVIALAGIADATAQGNDPVVVVVENNEAARRMRIAALQFLQGLTEEQRAQASFPLDDPERKRWSNLPGPMYEREGVSFGEMNPTQRVLAHRLLKSALTGQGYLKTSGIMHLDEVLLALARARGSDDPPFGLDLYWIGVFGDPARDRHWGWQLDGHHLALNFTVVGEETSVTPAFMGTDPAEVRSGPHAGWRILSDEDDLGRALFDSLTEEQRDKAVLAVEGPNDIIAGADNRDRMTEMQGLPASEMTRGQQTLLSQLIRTYANNVRPGLVESTMRGQALDTLHFAWMGTEEGKPYYYRIHGPNLWIEFDNSFPPGRDSGPINHIHTVWRHPKNDFGEDLLQKHYATSPHHRESGDE